MSKMIQYEEGEYWFEIPLPHGKLLSISTVTNDKADAAESEFCDGWGYYLCIWESVNGKRDSRILAKMISQEAAQELWMLLKGLAA